MLEFFAETRIGNHIVLCSRFSIDNQKILIAVNADQAVIDLQQDLFADHAVGNLVKPPDCALFIPISGAFYQPKMRTLPLNAGLANIF